jgi:hypothetical protein
VRNKAGKSISRGGFELVNGAQHPRRLDERQTLGACRRVQLLHGRGADAAPRRIEDPLEGKVVGRLVDQTEIGERVADLLALIKARPADHAVRQRQGNESLFELPRLESGAHQDRDLAQRMALALQRLDLLADPAGFIHSVPDRAHHDLVAFTRLGP